ncbi:MAG: hypothetical protein Q8L41_14675 [Anaerolineales bacterium]|nr:hypothetical protein [Anaerolineales bacterium]
MTARTAFSIELPKTAIIWPGMGVSSWGVRHGGAVRVYWLARTLDPDGSGHIDPENLKAAAVQLGVKPRTFDTWMKDALQIGIFEQLNKWTLRIKNQAETLRLLGARDVDKTRVIVPLKALFKNGWRAVIWAGYLKANFSKNEVNSQGENVTVYKHVSQKKLAELTGVSVSAQKNTLQKHVKSIQQIGITEHPASMVRMLNEYTSPNKFFPLRDPKQNNKLVAAVHLPSEKRVSNKTARTATRGRRRAILAHLQRYGLACPILPLSNIRQANKTITRLFYSTPNTQGLSDEQKARAVKKHEKALLFVMENSPLPQDPREVFVRRGKRHAWDVVPFGKYAFLKTQAMQKI